MQWYYNTNKPENIKLNLYNINFFFNIKYYKLKSFILNATSQSKHNNIIMYSIKQIDIHFEI